VLQFQQVRDFDGVGGDEAVVDLSEVAMQPIWPRPLLIRWNAKTDRYEMKALLSPQTTGHRAMRSLLTRQHSAKSDYARLLLDEVYNNALPIADASQASPSVRSYAVEYYVAEPGENYDPRGGRGGSISLLTSYFIRGRAHADANLLQVLEWRVDVTRDAIKAEVLLGRPLSIELTGRRPPDDTLRSIAKARDLPTFPGSFDAESWNKPLVIRG
jgi:hypothetical protein